MTLGSYLSSLFLRGKWVDGIYLIRLLVVTMWSYLYLVLDSCQGVTQPLLHTTADRELSRRGSPGPLRPTRLILTGSESLLCCSLTVVWSLSCIQLFATPWTVARQAPLSTGFPRQEYWHGLPFPSLGDPRDRICVSCIAGGFFTAELPGKPCSPTDVI